MQDIDDNAGIAGVGAGEALFAVQDAGMIVGEPVDQAVHRDAMHDVGRVLPCQVFQAPACEIPQPCAQLRLMIVTGEQEMGEIVQVTEAGSFARGDYRACLFCWQAGGLTSCACSVVV